MSIKLLIGDVMHHLPAMAGESVHCVVTSPPYFGLRDYGVPGQIGLEREPELFIQAMVDVFHEVRRVLREDGILVLDPFGGAGTTGLVADRLNRNAILIELNPAYAAMARERISQDAPLFADVGAA